MKRRTTLLGFLGLFVASCAAAAVGGAAAIGAVAYTNTGVKSEVRGDVAQVDQHAAQVFNQLGIRVTDSSVKGSGKERTLDGVVGDRRVTVDMKRSEQGTTHVEVQTKTSALGWDKDFSKRVMQALVQQA